MATKAKKSKVCTRLPDKLSELAALSLSDLIKCERSKKYRVYMSVWHERLGHQKACSVCLAGAVLAQTVKIRPETDVWYPSLITENPNGVVATEIRQLGFDDPMLDKKLLALDDLRMGDVFGAATRLGMFPGPEVPGAKVLPRVVMASYSDDSPSAFKRDFRRLIKTLREHGL